MPLTDTRVAEQRELDLLKAQRDKILRDLASLETSAALCYDGAEHEDMREAMDTIENQANAARHELED